MLNKSLIFVNKSSVADIMLQGKFKYNATPKIGNVELTIELERQGTWVKMPCLGSFGSCVSYNFNTETDTLNIINSILFYFSQIKKGDKIRIMMTYGDSTNKIKQTLKIAESPISSKYIANSYFDGGYLYFEYLSNSMPSETLFIDITGNYSV